MGYAKDREIQQDDQGWRFTGARVCYRCLSDKELVRFVREHATDFDCDFCDHISRKQPSSLDLDRLMELIGDILRQYYDRAVNAMAWDGEDDQYVGITYDSDDIVRELDISENEDVLLAIIDSLGDEPWCDRDPYSTTGFEAYDLSWGQFCNAVKHETRYFFSTRSATNTDDIDITPVGSMLREISSKLEEENLIATIDTTAAFIRVRVHDQGEHCGDWKALGPPPPNLAPSNRMSAAGISMFYASTNAPTAKAEAQASLKLGKKAGMTSASWSPTRDLRILDLCSILPTPSFWFTPRYERDKIRFLKAFTESITQPVVHDGREHIEYVPTQILTEYFRHEYRTLDGHHRIDGIFYPSAQDKRGKNVVIFANQEELTPTAERPYSNDKPLLTLDTGSIKRLRNHRR